MGFWSKLGKIGALVGAGAATIATGGAAAPALGMAAKIGTLASVAGNTIGAMGKQAAENRYAQDQRNADYFNAAARHAGNMVNAEVNQRQDARTAQNNAYQNALRAALAQNMQDVSIDRSQFRSNVPNISFSGGLRPSAIGPLGRQAAALMAQQSMQQLQNPQPYMKLPTLAFPEQSKASFWEKLSGPLAFGLTAGGLVAQGIDANNQAKGNTGLSTLPPGAQWQSPVFDMQPRNDMLPSAPAPSAPAGPTFPNIPFQTPPYFGNREAPLLGQQTIRW